MSSNQIYFPLLLTLLAGLSTVLGSFIVFSIKKFNKNYLSFFLGLSAGVMIYISFMELIPASIKSIGFIKSNVVFFLGILFIILIDFFLPHNYLEEKICGSSIVDKKIFSTMLMTIIGIIIHNFPAGIAVFISSFGNLKFGIVMALAIAIHNIPEGMAVSAPVYYATKNKIKAVKYAFIAGIAEPIGGLFAFLLLQPFLTPVFLSYVFAFVAGVMVFISLDELLPASFENGHGHVAISGIILGMLIVSLSLMTI